MFPAVGYGVLAWPFVQLNSGLIEVLIWQRGFFYSSFFIVDCLGFFPFSFSFPSWIVCFVCLGGFFFPLDSFFFFLFFGGFKICFV